MLSVKNVYQIVGYNMLSGKTMYYNSIKSDTNKADSYVTVANGSAKGTTVLGKLLFVNIKYSFLCKIFIRNNQINYSNQNKNAIAMCRF